MESMVIWFFLALVQGQGVIGFTETTYAECFSEWQKAEASSSVVAISECKEVTVKRNLPSEKS